MKSADRDIARYTQDFLAEDYQFEHILRNFRYAEIAQSLAKNRARRVLEIGCGTKSIFSFYKNFERWTIIEPSAEFCAAVQNAPDFDSQKIEIVQGFLEEKVADLKKRQPFDFIIFCGILHEIENQMAVLSAIHSLCAQKTRVHVITSNNQSFHLLWAFEAGLIPNTTDVTATGKRFQRFSTFNLETLQEILKAADFKILESGSYFIKPFDHAKMQKALKIGLLDENLLQGLNQLTKYFPQNGAEIFVLCEPAKNA